MELYKKYYKSILAFIEIFLTSILIGALGGLIGVAFHELLDISDEVRSANPIIILFLPLAGIAIVAIYKFVHFEKSGGTNDIIASVRSDEKAISPLVMPLLFISTTLTHLFGGSSGKEGAALQIGGSLGYNAAKILKSGMHVRRILTLCGMSAVFASLFGTPIAAAILPLEFVNVGLIYSASIFPCLLSSVTAVFTAKLFGLNGLAFPSVHFPSPSPQFVLVTLLLAAIAALVSIGFCFAMKGTSALYKKLFANPYLRICVAGILVVILTYIFGHDYNGAGTHIIRLALSGSADSFAFIIKLVFTVVTMCAGFKGGEIVPSLFIGATLGCVIAPFLGFSAPVCAALTMVGMFCGVTNSPIASIFIGIELFGADSALFMALVCAVSFALSGNVSLYSAQKMVFSKIRGYKEK